MNNFVTRCPLGTNFLFAGLSVPVSQAFLVVARGMLLPLISTQNIGIRFQKKIHVVALTYIGV